MLILLGAVGGALRGALDLYIQFVNWRSARGRHRQQGQGQALEQGQAQAAGQELPPPRFLDYFDPAVDLTAAVVHSAMGAALAVLFGMTGQISGPYAAIVVGISAPVILTQLARIQSVSEAVAPAPGVVDSAAQPVPAVPPVEGGDYGAPAAPAVTGGAMAVPAQPSQAAQYVRPAAVHADTEAAEPQPNGRPADPAGGTGRGPVRGGRDTPSLPHGRAAGEEGTP